MIKVEAGLVKLERRRGADTIHILEDWLWDSLQQRKAVREASHHASLDGVRCRLLAKEDTIASQSNQGFVRTQVFDIDK